MNDSDKQVFKQREFLRLRTSLPVRLMYLPKDGRVPDTEWAAGTMSEIGGGGARIQAYMEMEVDDALTIRFVIPDTERDPDRLWYSGQRQVRGVVGRRQGCDLEIRVPRADKKGEGSRGRKWSVFIWSRRRWSK
jgi:hypothetical protein